MNKVRNRANHLTQDNWYLLLHMAKEYSTPQVSIEELISEGWWGCIRYQERTVLSRFLRVCFVKYLVRRQRSPTPIGFIDDVVPARREERRRVRDALEFDMYRRCRPYRLCR